MIGTSRRRAAKQVQKIATAVVIDTPTNELAGAREAYYRWRRTPQGQQQAHAQAWSAWWATPDGRQWAERYRLAKGVQARERYEASAAFAAYAAEWEAEMRAKLGEGGYAAYCADADDWYARIHRTVRPHTAARPRERRACCTRRSRITAGTSSSDDPHELAPALAGHTSQELGRHPVVAA